MKRIQISVRAIFEKMRAHRKRLLLLVPVAAIAILIGVIWYLNRDTVTIRAVPAHGGRVVVSEYNLSDRFQATILPNDGWVFDRWDNSNPRRVKALFKEEERYTLEIQIEPESGGRVTPFGDRGLGLDATYTYQVDSKVTVAAIPNNGWLLDHWEGDVQGSELSSELVIDGDKKVKAVFRQAKLVMQGTDLGIIQHLALADGRVVVFSLVNEENAVNTQVFDPESQKWENLPLQLMPRASFKVVEQQPGQVMITGGEEADAERYDFPYLDKVELVDIDQGTVKTVASMNYARAGHAMASLPDGKVIVTGGKGLKGVEIYDPQSDSWQVKSSMQEGYDGHVAYTYDQGQKVLVFTQKVNHFGIPGFTIYDVESDSWSVGITMSFDPLNYMRAVIAGEDELIMFEDISSNRIDYYNPFTDSWREERPFDFTMHEYEVIRLSNGNLFLGVFESAQRTEYSDPNIYTYNQVYYVKSTVDLWYLYDAETHTWREVSTLPIQLGDASLAPLPDGKVLAFNATSEQGGQTTDSYLYDSVADTWTMPESDNGSPALENISE